LQQAIIDQCDAQDGLKDGVVQDPPSAHFDLSKVAGLTDEQRKAIEAIYAGAQRQRADLSRLHARAECDPQPVDFVDCRTVAIDGQRSCPDLMFAFGTQIFKYLVFNNPDWNYATYDFSNFAGDTRLAASFLDATNVNLG
jgi:hypothetical protein